MGRLKSWQNLNPLFSGKYKKLLEEYGSKDYSRLLLQESLQDYLSYACGHCGHIQKLQVIMILLVQNISCQILLKCVSVYKFEGVVIVKRQNPLCYFRPSY